MLYFKFGISMIFSSIYYFYFFFFFNLGPVVQSMVSLTSSLVINSLNVVAKD